MSFSRTILVTGGAGFIGSHTCVELLTQGYRVVVVDNLVNSRAESIARVCRIASQGIVLIEDDACSRAGLEKIFDTHSIDAVIHFAALKVGGESAEHPLRYYRNNLDSLLTLLETMQARNVKTLVFSSSAAVYGNTTSVPTGEQVPMSSISPYGWTKQIAEQILQDLMVAEPGWRIAALRYFNPAGAHESGLIGEDPAGVPTNLMPIVAEVATGRRASVRVFGNDYDTPDGTGLRDYIHVVDLARGHLAALDALFSGQDSFTVNLGTGRGYTVLQVIEAFERVSGRKIPFQIVGRRAGDIGASYADPSKAMRLLGWRAEYDIDRMCQDHWRWQSQNPDGYGKW